jgi:hypothetical protein
MAVAGRAHSDAGVAIEKGVAVDVFHPNSLCAFGDKLERGARI